ncbi:MAG: hypothetical protein U0269_30325 [Polyangiales bacterium]
MKTERIAQHGDEGDGDEGGAFPPVYPLFPDAPLGTIDYLIAQRVLDDSAARPGADKRVRYKVWPERFDPITTDEVTIAECCGGGTYDIRAVGAKGRTVGGMRLELEGPSREYSAPNTEREASPVQREPSRAPAAVEQAAPGVLAVRGLDPNVQAVLAMMQANNERAEKQLEAQRLAMQQEAQRARDDAKMMNETMVRMVEATVKGSAPPTPQAPLDQQLILRMIDRMDRQRERDEDRAERRRRRDERDEGEGGIETILEKAPALLSAFPALQQKLAEAMTPMLKDSAKEIVAGVLNEMAGKAG